MAHTHSKQPAAPLSLRIAPEVIQELEALSLATGRTKSFLAAEAIERYLQAESWQIQAIQQTLKKTNSSHATFIDHDQMTDWLNSWGTEKEQDAP